MAYLSEMSVWSSKPTPSAESSDVAPRVILFESHPTPWTPEACRLERRPNDRLNEFLALRRPVRPWRMGSMYLVFARELVDVLVDELGWKLSLAQRIVAFLVIGQQ